MSLTLLIRKIEDIPPRERGRTFNHLHALHPTVVDEQIMRLRSRVEKGGAQGVWEIHDHRVGMGFGDGVGGILCSKRCLRVESVEVGDPGEGEK